MSQQHTADPSSVPQRDGNQADLPNIPPYEGRSTGRGDSALSDELTGTVERQMAGTKTGNPGATASPADESPVDASEVSSGPAGGAGDTTATDTDATTAGGVGVSTTRRGEDVAGEDGKEAGRQDAGTQGPTDRPVGTSTARDVSGIDPQGS